MNKTPTTRTLRRGAAGLAAAALLAFPLAACGSEDDGGSGNGGSGSVSAIAEVKNLDQGVDTQVTFDEGFAGALGDLGVTPSPFGKATFADGTISFPITGGNVSLFEEGSVPNYVIGQVQHEGSGLTLTAGDTSVTVGNFNVDPGVSIAYGDVAVNKKVAATSIPIFRLDGSTLNDPVINDDGTVVLQGTTVYLTDAAADLLNKTFGIKDLTGDIVIGIAKITVQS